jgi:nucleoside-diphosphate-sugar epimerase
MKVLITGGAGFLGLHLARFFAEKDWQISLLDVAPYPRNEYPKNCSFINGDIRERQIIERIFKNTRFDAVIHAAAALPLWKKEEIFAVNVEGTKNLLEASFKQKVKRFVYVSSTAVYGIPKKHPLYENASLIGVGPYGESKIAAEELCREYRKKGMIVIVVRPKTFVGTHRLGVFEILFDWIKDGKKIPMVGSGKNRYQLLDVDDLVEAIYLLISFKDAKEINETFNIGAEKFKTVQQDLQELFDYAHSGSTILPTPAWLVKKTLFILEKLHLSPLYQWVYETADKDSYVSINRLTKTLNWNPKYSNSQALIKAYQWYLDHYREIKSRTPGVTHTVGWKQGILGVIKKFL